MIIPDSIEPVVGYRAWLLVPSTLRLYSISHKVLWEPGVEMVATCNRHDEPPVDSCSCGLYAAMDFNHLFEMGYTKKSGVFAVQPGQIAIAGEIAMWGGVIPGTQGWRAQFGYPQRFLIPYSYWKLAQPIANEYSVPYRLFNLERKHDED